VARHGSSDLPRFPGHKLKILAEFCQGGKKKGHSPGIQVGVAKAAAILRPSPFDPSPGNLNSLDSSPNPARGPSRAGLSDQ
jgi:hypothetical protein